jgi:thioredoxin 1
LLGVSAFFSQPSSGQEPATVGAPPKQSASFKDDFSEKQWTTGSSAFGNLWYEGGEYHMHATSGGFIVIYAPGKKEYGTENATISVTARSVYENGPNTGYGMVVYGEKKSRQLEDYGFLIFTGPNPKYKIVVHKGGTEKVLLDWTPSGEIQSGTRPNRLEVKTRDQDLEFSVNGRHLTTIPDSEGWKRGMVGLYTSQTNDVAFDDLEIVRESNQNESPVRTGTDAPTATSPTGKPQAAETLDPVKTKRDLYPANADAKKEIEEALQEAAAEKKRVLLMFGGNWCYDCHVLDRALREGEAGKLMKESFLLVHVDIGEGDKNLDLVKKYKTTLDKGVPVVVILGADGSALYSSDGGEFEAARTMMKKDLVAFLSHWKGKRRV